MLYHSSTENSINAILDNGIEEIKLPTIDSLTNGTAKGIGSYGVGFYGYLDDAKLSKYFFIINSRITNIGKLTLFDLIFARRRKMC